MDLHEKIAAEQERHNIAPPLEFQHWQYLMCGGCSGEIEKATSEVFDQATKETRIVQKSYRVPNRGIWENGKLTYYHVRCLTDEQREALGMESLMPEEVENED